MLDQFLQWPRLKNIKACFSMRTHGFSLAPFDSLNLALHVGDDPEKVRQNRMALKDRLKLPADPFWLNQTHSTRCLIAETAQDIDADASISHSSAYPLVLMTADCLPILLCNKEGDEIAAIHAGWQGLLDGIIENSLNLMSTKPSELLAYIGPSICQSCYETSFEIKAKFAAHYPQSISAFKDTQVSTYLNLPGVAAQILNNAGIQVLQSNLCTFESKEHFFSYRREKQTGRIATLIWFNNSP